MSGETILVVDDDQSICDVLSDILATAGHRITKCLDGHSALEVIGRSQFDLVILDVPPSLVVTDANVLANRADGVLLVIRPSISKRAEITRTVEQLSQVKANIIGIVINGVNVKSSRYKSYSHYYRKSTEGYISSLSSRTEKHRKKKINKDQDSETTLPPEAKVL